ncbi:ADP-ribosylglycohydrolase [Exophiala viscosa]|uniref:ADP-ribosylhydrolase ARH3 n=2 Tax=Exophiala viscosa TaxID=2486360 RepID=A0AAN6II86_9EURO|nr:ADP-ribosylglycohydrolase [Exophiala viscosa]
MPVPVPFTSRVKGALVGLAVCDALGAPVEFKKRGSFPEVNTMLPNENFGTPAGSFTDDTSMALCLAHSLLDNGGETNIADQVKKYIAWWQEGYMSSTTGTAFDIGAQTKDTLTEWFKYLEEDYDNLDPDSVEAEQALRGMQKKVADSYSKEQCCGNGSLMRVLPVALIARSEPDVVRLAKESSLITHPHLRCAQACMVYSALVYQTLNGASRTEMAISLAESINDPDPPNNITDFALEPVLRERIGRYQKLEDWESTLSESIRSTGYVVDSLEAALWAFFKSDGFEEGAILAANLGDDADTIGAIYGGLAGAYHGVEAIPEKWLKDMKKMDIVNEVVDGILTYRNQTVLT